MNMEDHVINVMSEVLDVSCLDIDVDDYLEYDLKLDSLEIVELQIALEIEFEVRFDDEEFEMLDTVQEVIDYTVLYCECERV